MRGLVADSGEVVNVIVLPDDPQERSSYKNLVGLQVIEVEDGDPAGIGWTIGARSERIPPSEFEPEPEIAIRTEARETPLGS